MVLVDVTLEVRLLAVPHIDDRGLRGMRRYQRIMTRYPLALFDLLGGVNLVNKLSIGYRDFLGLLGVLVLFGLPVLFDVPDLDLAVIRSTNQKTFVVRVPVEAIDLPEMRLEGVKRLV